MALDKILRFLKETQQAISMKEIWVHALGCGYVSFFNDDGEESGRVRCFPGDPSRGIPSCGYFFDSDGLWAPTLSELLKRMIDHILRGWMNADQWPDTLPTWEQRHPVSLR
jgi:hypothetical protein